MQTNNMAAARILYLPFRCLAITSKLLERCMISSVWQYIINMKNTNSLRSIVRKSAMRKVKWLNIFEVMSDNNYVDKIST
jgi:hypothetical protein